MNSIVTNSIDYQRHKSKWIYILWSLTLLAIGGSIYVIYRKESLFMFSVFNKLGFSESIHFLRSIGNNYHFSDWIIYSLPDGLWLFSYLLIIESIWGGTKTYSYYIYLWVLPVAAIISEILQVSKFVPGVFDVVDILCYALALLFFFSPKLLKLQRYEK